LSGGINIFAYVVNNPINFVDLFGLQYVLEGSNEFKKQFEDAVKYLSRSKQAAKLFEDLKNNPKSITIKQTTGQDTWYNDNVLYWDPISAMELCNSQKQTPALNLLHEAAHALGDLEENRKSLANKKGDPYHNAEERRVIIGIETPVAKELGEGTRDNHRGKRLYHTEGPTSVKSINDGADFINGEGSCPCQ
jgi:hypothetical protein